jgi:hypothetical protein
MKIHQYNEMMRYLTRPPRLETSTSSPDTIVPATISPDASSGQRETYAEGTIPKAISEEKQNMIQKINEYVNEKLNVGEQVTTKDIQDEFGFKTKKDALIKEALGSEYEDKITKKEILKKETSLASKVNNQLGMGPSAIADVGEEVFTEARGLYGKYAPQIAKSAAAGLRVIGTPAVSTVLYVNDIIDDLKEAANQGSTTASKALSAFVGKGEKGLYFMLPELAKDVVTNPVVSKILQLGSIGRFANPLGAALTVTGVGKDFYDQYQEFKSLPEEQKQMLRKQFTYDQDPGQATAIENMGREGAAYGGRIGYADGSDDESELPTLNSKGSNRSGIYNSKRLGPEDPISKYESYSELELLGNISAKKPNYQIEEENMLDVMPIYEPRDTVPKGSRPVMPNIYDRGPSDGILRLSKGGIVWKK